MRERIRHYIRRHGLMQPGDRLGVAVSGGADSVGLLRLLLEMRGELGIVPAVVHFNHKIRGAEADADERFVRELAATLDLEFFSDSADTPAYAVKHKVTLEAAARELRYRFFDELTSQSTREGACATLTRVATAHTRDDQAETVLLRLLRGSGTRGLAGIYPGVGGWISISVRTGRSGEAAPVTPAPPTGFRIVRPLLEVSRAEVRAYLQQIGQTWREDASNLDVSFTRNRLRHEILPRLRQINPNLDEVLSEMAEIARAEEEWWERVGGEAQVRAFTWKAKATPDSPPEPVINLERLRAEPLAVQRRLLRGFGWRGGLEFQHVEQLRELAMEPSQAVKRIELPGDWDAVRAGQELWFERRCQTERPQDYDLALPVPGEIDIPQAGIAIAAVLAKSGDRLARASVGELRVRNWRPGDRYWPAHTAAPKKLKELLQARHIPRANKASWPVVVSGVQIVWVPGFALPEQWQVREGGTEGVRLTQLPLQNRRQTGP